MRYTIITVSSKLQIFLIYPIFQYHDISIQVVTPLTLSLDTKKTTNLKTQTCLRIWLQTYQSCYEHLIKEN